jgi:hypothetical protein
MTELRQRQPRVEDRAFLAFVRRQRCRGCGVFPPVQAAHLRRACPERGKRETGAGEKPDDRWSVPLCSTCHLDGPGALHKVEEERFFARIGVDPFLVAAALFAEFVRADGRKPMMGPGLECEFVIDDATGVQRSPTPETDPELYVFASDSPVKVRRPKRKRGTLRSPKSAAKSRRRNKIGNKKRVSSRPLKSASRWPPRGARKIANRRKG